MEPRQQVLQGPEGEMVALKSKTTGQKVATSPLLSGPGGAEKGSAPCARDGSILVWKPFTLLSPTWSSLGSVRTQLHAPLGWLGVPDGHLLEPSPRQP